MEFASEMVFKAYRRGLTVSEVPIDYYPRVGESKLNRFGDAWRHVRFMLLYSPSWLYLVPGSILLLLGLVGMVVLATGPIDLFGHTWQIHTMLGFVAMTLIGAQVIQLGVFARTYARVRIGERDPLLERLGPHSARARSPLRRSHVLRLGRRPRAVGVEWASNGFGALGREYETALLVTGLGLGIQIVFGAFFLALLTMPLRRDIRQTALRRTRVDTRHRWLRPAEPATAGRPRPPSRARRHESTRARRRLLERLPRAATRRARLRRRRHRA